MAPCQPLIITYDLQEFANRKRDYCRCVSRADNEHLRDRKNSLRFIGHTYPSFEILDHNNQLVGFDIDLAKVLRQQIKARCTFTNNAFDSLIPLLKFRRYDAVISGMDITAERSQQVDFTQLYYANSAIIIAHKGVISPILAS